MNESAKRYCVMPSCKGEKMDLVHKFPRNDERAREWLNIINLPELSDIPLEQLRKSKFVCTRHFAPEAYKHAESRSLNINAVPSRNLEKLETLEHIMNRGRKGRNVILSHPQPNEDGTVVKCFETDKVEEEKGVEEILMLPTKKKLSKVLNLMPVKRRKIIPNVVVQKQEELLEIDSEKEEIPEVLEEEVLEEIVPDEPKIDFLEIEDELKYPGGIRLNYFWLRDHCRCDECYEKTQFQRKINLNNINLDIRPIEYEIEQNSLRVKWPGDHESSYDLDFLYNSQYSVKRVLYEKSDAILWDHELIETMDYARVDLSDLLCNESAVKVVLESLIKFGVAFVNKVPATQHSTEMTITRLFPLMKTFFGEMWTFSDTKDHNDFAYTNNYLPPHNDNTYFNDAAGIQILHCIQHQGEGGDNYLIDGFKVIETLRNEHPDSFHRLTTYQIPSEYIEEGRHHHHVGPIIKLNPLTGNPEQLRFNMYDRAILDTIPFNKIQEFYGDLQLLSNEIQKTSNAWRFKLSPGTVLFFDNWRVMHGRHEYTGKRVMTGAYVLRTEFLSAARVAKVIS